jgi:hypothetical protein
MPAHHENQLRGEPRVEQTRAEHMKLKLLSLGTSSLADSLPAGAAAFRIVVTSSRQPDGRSD